MPLGGAWLTPRGGFKPRRGAARGAILSGQGRSALRGCVVAMAAAGASGLYVNPNTGAAQAGLAPFRNALINGDMRINQRGTSTNLASLTAVGTTFAYSCDRWHAYRHGFVTGTAIGQGTTLTVGDMPFDEAGITTFSRISRLSGNTGTQLIYFAYNMESQDSVKYKNKPVTLSFYVRGGANFSGSILYSEIISGTGTDQVLRSAYTNSTVEQQKTTALSTSWIKVTLTKTVSSVLNQIGVRFVYTPTGTAGAADYFDVTGVQLELGSVATPFEVRPYPVELQLCQRYYIRWVATKLYTHFPVTGYISSPGNFFGTIITQTNLRISPNSQSQFTTSGLFEIVGAFQSSNIVIDIDSSSINSFRILATGTGGTAGFGGVLRAAASIGAFLAIDVEL